MHTVQDSTDRERTAIRQRSKTSASPAIGGLSISALDHAAKACVLLACLAPLLVLCERWLGGGDLDLGTNPVETLTNETGVWSLRLLWVVLIITPLRKWLGWSWLISLRRQIALTSFLYGVLHLLIYLVFEMEFDWGDILHDIGKRPFILAGVLALLIMIPLAITSTNAMIKRLGGRNWKRLHRLTYAAAVLVAFHYLLLVKQDITRPGIYILLLALMFVARLEEKKRPSASPRS